MALPSDTIKPRLADFATYARSSLKGDEKGEAQIFLERFFQAFGHVGVKEAGATLEYRIAKKPGSAQLELITNEPAPKGKGVAKSGGKKFADLLWPDRVLIEMKKRGENLEKHYDQIFDYWTQIVPKRPPYAILCNFDEFWIYDFTQQLYDPVDKIPLSELANRWSSLTFLLPQPRPPVFDNNRVQVTRKAAAQMAGVFRTLVEQRQIDRPRAQRFILQLLVALVSEDLGLLQELIVTRALGDALKDPASAYDLLGGLFRAMDTPGRTDGGRFAGVEYFNGGLFSEIDPVELKASELYALEAAAKEDWSAIKPDIFGTIFQQSMDKGERHAYGAHFTSEFDIQKVVGPTIVRPWRARIEAACTLTELRTLLGELRQYRVLDPACGSGNFLYVAYREMKRLERDLLVRLRDKGEKPERLVSAVALTQFFGIDKVPFAVELARVTLMLAKELELAEAKKTEDTDGLLVFEKPLPLDNLDQQIICGDSLFTPWPKVDAIIGNPPYLGAKLLKPEYGPDYVNQLRAAYPQIPGMADFCVYWFWKAHQHLPATTKTNPATGRAGLVGTQNIRNNASRIGGLDYITQDGTIVEAVDIQPWSGDANVHVSIVNWVKTQDAELLPAHRKLWFKIDDHKSNERRTPGTGPASKIFQLGWREPDHITSTLSDEIDVSAAGPLVANTHPQRCFNGQMVGHEALLITAQERAEMVKRQPNVAEVTYPYLNGVDALTGATFDRFVIDFEQRDRFTAASYTEPFDYVRTHVLPDRERKAEEGKDAGGQVRPHHKAFLARWWQLSFGRPEMLAALKPLNRFLACSYVTKRPIFLFVSANSQSNRNAVSLPNAGGGGEVAMKSYRQLSADERVQIATLRYQNFSLPRIARIVGRHRSTVWREVQRNRAPYDGGYRSARAQERAVARRKRSRRNQQFGGAQLRRVEALLRQQWSPEQVAGHLRAQGEFSISHETIYRHVWHDRRRGGSLHLQLRGARKLKRKRYGHYDSRGRLAGKRHISERPSAVENRRQSGHWEIDTVMGSTHECVVTLVERQSGYLLVGKMRARTTAELNRATFELMCQHPERFRTITADNGTEFHDYRSLEAATGVPFYFATPHHSWERGTNENTNGLLRQYLPKGTSLASLTQSRCDAIAETLNIRPRKRHAYKTPKACFSVALQS